MPVAEHPNIEILEIAAEKLGGLVEEVVFLATKFEAFDHRGRGDYTLSRDMEDLVTVIDGRKEIVDEVLGAPEGLRSFLSNRIRALIGDSGFLDAMPGFLPPDAASQARSRVVVARLQRIGAFVDD